MAASTSTLSSTSSTTPTYTVAGIVWRVIAPGCLQSARTRLGSFQISGNPRCGEWNVSGGSRCYTGFATANAAAKFVATLL